MRPVPAFSQVHRFRRLASYLIDYAAVVCIAAVAIRQLEISADEVKAVLAGCYFAYFFLLEGAIGRTLGKLLMSTKVLRLDGSPIDWNDAVLRSLSRLVPFEPLSYKDGSFWHDRWTGTRVVSRGYAPSLGIAEPKRANAVV